MSKPVEIAVDVLRKWHAWKKLSLDDRIIARRYGATGIREYLSTKIIDGFSYHSILWADNEVGQVGSLIARGLDE